MITTQHDSILVAGWKAPMSVQGLITTRRGGKSKDAYHSFNLATHVGDQREDVSANRQRLSNILGFDGEPNWINQVHGSRVIEAGKEVLPQADAIYTTRVNKPIGVLVADCVPVLMCDLDGTCVAAIHAGWKGLASGILQATARALPTKSTLMAWLGPAIGPCHYEVGVQVRDAFPGMDECFHPASRPDHWMFDMWALATRQLESAGIFGVYGGGICTYCDAANFYSYRRQGQAGRMAALTWLSC